MQPSNTNYSKFADPPSFYTLQQNTFDSQPQPPHQLIITDQPPAIETAPNFRRRIGRADRHSKIRTARGERDRRMRLSVQVAQEFFALQDKLGFDKASKTIDWLLTQAKDSIDQLTSSSTGERYSAEQQNPNEELPSDHHHLLAPPLLLVHQTEIAEGTREGDDQGQMRARDLRAKARARARDRAKEKMKGVNNGQLDQTVSATTDLVSGGGNGSCSSSSSMEYYCFLLNEILNGGFCSVDFDDEEEGNTSSANAQFY